jgi:cytochrome c-type biogenesis protein CcmH
MLPPLPAQAVQPDEMLQDAKLEARARDLSAGLRCLVCQNQSIDDSNAPLARDLRVLVRERLQAGESDAQVTAYIVERYGEYVLLKPPFRWNTMLLWLMPLLALAVGFAAALRGVRGGVAPAGRAAALSSAEEEKLKRILQEGEGP